MPGSPRPAAAAPDERVDCCMTEGHQQPPGLTGITSVSASILSSAVTSDEGIAMRIIGLKDAEGRLAELIDEVANGE